ncbi:MAG: hypothetical protein HPY71_03265 [Firmicutes bacterium]|nr:hypothetical protein [Bacillota bacterium]
MVGERESLGGLATEVMEKSRSPRDFYEVAALLESMGWTDSQARSVFGYDNVFELAKDVLDLCRKNVITKPVVREKRFPFFIILWDFIKSYLRGIMFAMPMAVSIFAMLTIRYSLWSYQYFSVEIATAIAIGTILSFLVTGGFTQAIARRGLMYIGQNEYNLARRFSFLMIRVGLIVIILAALAALAFNLVFEIFPLKMMSYILIYYFFLSCIWLTTTVLYMLRHELLFTGITVIGMITVILLHELFRLDIMLSQAIGLTITALLIFAMAAWLFHQHERRAEQGVELAPVPRMSLVVYTVIPYFIYGLLYFGFIYIDRVIAWSANSLFMPYVIWFRGEYELGLDWALLTLILPMGVVEVLINNFWMNLTARQKSFLARDSTRFNQIYVSTYRRQMALYAATAGASGIAVYFGMRLIDAYRLLDLHLFQNRVTYFVFAWGVVSYALIAAGLLNSLYLFSLSRPEPVVRAVLYASGADMLLGFVLSREIDYYYAVLGLVGGALVFFVLTSRYAVEALGALDFHVYSSV